MNRLPEPPARQPHATTAGQPTPDTTAAAAFLAEIEDAMATAPTTWRDPRPLPAYGPTPPVPQPGRPPMSQRAVDLNTTILTSSVLTIAIGGAATGILWASGHADPTVIGYIAAAPAALAIPILALSRLVKRTKEVVEAAPPVINQTYNGTVNQYAPTVNSTNRGLWASTRNQLPAAE
ncbi:hypothetical protein ACF1GW_38785 [Streptomyces achromogenes]|uniref:hypothetical protein n=1 Tax=Streptomyces achromogenes TaxID=67255 RepID=UPI0036FE3C08